MKTTARTLPLLILAMLSCRSAPPKQKPQIEPTVGSLYGATFAPLFDAFMLKHGSLDLLYGIESFRNRNGRWPADYTELTNFVRASNGYLWLGTYDRVDFTQLTNGSLQISYVRPGQTNETKFTFGDVIHPK